MTSSAIDLTADTRSMRIRAHDVEAVLRTGNGLSEFRKVLWDTRSPDRLLQILYCYTEFNSIFGAGVANLSGHIAVRQDLFRDSGEPVYALADRSVEVAAAVFLSAVEEFGDLTQPTHRSLAQRTFRAALAFFGYDPPKLDGLFTRRDPATDPILRRICAGYCLDRKVDDHSLLAGIGFHIGSELLADGEFHLVDQFLRQHYPELVAQLIGDSDGSGSPSAYAWIAIHTKVEAEHFRLALEAANRALSFYTGPATLRQVRDSIFDGLRAFTEVHADFMRSLMSESA